MYCRAGQQTEEEMYNNEEGGPAFNEFLDLLGQRVRLKGFNKYKAGLCNKSESLNIFLHVFEIFLSCLISTKQDSAIKVSPFTSSINSMPF